CAMRNIQHPTSNIQRSPKFQARRKDITLFGSAHPGAMDENSPTFQRWVKCAEDFFSPKGTTCNPVRGDLFIEPASNLRLLFFSPAHSAIVGAGGLHSMIVTRHQAGRMSGAEKQNDLGGCFSINRSPLTGFSLNVSKGSVE